MISDIKFYKAEDNRWYAHLPEYLEEGGTLEACEMVAGADVWLDIVSGNSSEVVLRLSSNKELQERIVLYDTDLSKPEEGATYIAYTYKGSDYNITMWLCPVTLFVFNEYPKFIYYEKV
jgi:hypothetical protein